MLHRVARDGGERPGDVHSGKWNGLGGKLEPGESPEQAGAREVLEEAGMALKPDVFKTRGVLQFPYFKPGQDWLVWVLVATTESSELSASWGPEGRLEWVAVDEVLDLPLWEGDRQFLPPILRGETVFGTFWYRDGRLDRFRLQNSQLPNF